MNKISSISFGSTYHIYQKEHNYMDYSNVYELIPDKEKGVTDFIENYENGYRTATIVADDNYDKYIETYLKFKNIKFTKQCASELNDENNIKSRIYVPNQKYYYPKYLPTLFFVNTDKFDRLYSESNQYLGSYDSMQHTDKTRYKGIQKLLKTGLPISASEVYIDEISGKPNIFFMDGRHRYALYRDMGFKSIPVAMSLETYNKAVELGLLASDK